MLPKLIVIEGTNASGKSALAVDLATRFDGEIVSALGLPPTRKHYIRLERISVVRDAEDRLKKEKKKKEKNKKNKKDKDQSDAADGQTVIVPGVVEMQEYYGLYIKYYVRAEGQTLKVIEKNDGINIYEPGEQVELLIRAEDVMSY